MTKLFAAVDKDGEIRFVGEVPRGSGCGCFCPVCSSPLVAKMGAVNEWHFAHERGQERAECWIGAMNLLRRLTVQYLTQSGHLEFPAYEQQVTFKSPHGDYSERVRWEAQPIMSTLSCPPVTAAYSPVICGQLTTGVPFEVVIAIEDQYPRFPPVVNREVARIVFWARMPWTAALNSREIAMEHVRSSGQFIWLHHPDHQMVVAKATAKLKALADQREQQVRDRWASARLELTRRREDEAVARASHEREVDAARQERERIAKVPDDRFAWAPNKKRDSTLIFYRLRDKSEWVLYTQLDESQWLVPYPYMFEGWDEALPQIVGDPLPRGPGYRIRSLIDVLSYLGPRAETVRSGADPGDFE